MADQKLVVEHNYELSIRVKSHHFFKYLIASMLWDIFVRREIMGFNKELNDEIRILARIYSDQQL